MRRIDGLLLILALSPLFVAAFVPSTTTADLIWARQQGVGSTVSPTSFLQLGAVTVDSSDNKVEHVDTASDDSSFDESDASGGDDETYAVDLDDSIPTFLDLEELEEETNQILQLDRIDMETVRRAEFLMTVWARRGAPVRVEEIVKFIVDHMRGGNTDITVTAKTYTILMHSWVKCGISRQIKPRVAAERAQEIHDAMMEQYHHTKDENLAPNLKSYNTLIHACIQAKNFPKAEEILATMIEAWQNGQTELKPDSRTMANLIDGYGKARKLRRAIQLFEQMDAMNIRKLGHAYGSLQNAYAVSSRTDAGDQAMALLREMIAESESDPELKPTIVHFNCVLRACARAATPESARMTLRLLDQITRGEFENVRPDKYTYNGILWVLAKNGDPASSVTALKILKQVEDAATKDPVDAYAVPLEASFYNAVLRALAFSNHRDANIETKNLIARMHDLVKLNHDVLPTRQSYNSYLQAMLKSTSPDQAFRCALEGEQLLERMHSMDSKGVEGMRPDSLSYTSILSIYQKSPNPSAAMKADAFIRNFQKRYEEGLVDYPPDVAHFTRVISLWAKSSSPVAVRRCAEIFRHLFERHRAGYRSCLPTTRTYNAFLDALKRHGRPEETEQVLYYMLDQHRRVDQTIAPDGFTFYACVLAFTSSKLPDAGQRAENILERYIQYVQDENPSIRLTTRCFLPIIYHYSRSAIQDAPYRAELLMYRLVDLILQESTKVIHTDELTDVAFEAIILSFVSKKLGDGGPRAEKLLKTMKALKTQGATNNIEAGSRAISAVIAAWTVSDDPQAAMKADIHLDTMERSFATGDRHMRPTTQSYRDVLKAYAKSNVEGKGERSLGVLQRMQRQAQNGNGDAVQPDALAMSLVINACSFSNTSEDEEIRSFRIGRQVFNELLESGIQPIDVSYGWFFQLCARLPCPEEERQMLIERAFKDCCDRGLVSNMVISRLRGAICLRAPALYAKLLEPATKRNPKLDLACMLRKKDIPPSWQRNLGQTKTERREHHSRLHRRDRRR